MLHPTLVNGRFGDPALFVQLLHRREALLFDAGDLSALSTRDLLRVSHLFVSHMHMDHFIGFDALLRVNVGREKIIRVIGPAGIGACAGHKLHGYDWDLARRPRELRRTAFANPSRRFACQTKPEDRGMVEPRGIELTSPNHWKTKTFFQAVVTDGTPTCNTY